jgi:uncharacterized membrane protein SirB2
VGLDKHPGFNTNPLIQTKGRKIMRIFWSLVGIVLIFAGGIWFLQGINVIPGSFMTGQSQWALYGGITFIIGMVLMLVANRKKAVSTKNKS